MIDKMVDEWPELGGEGKFSCRDIIVSDVMMSGESLSAAEVEVTLT